MASSSSTGPMMWLLLVVFSLSLSCYGAEGREIMSFSISKEEDLELERQLKILNKPPIKTFQTKADIFDCIDINNQPALDHPLLKNHKVQISPTSRPKQLIDGTSSSEGRAKLNSIDCPQGTVPIRRTRKEDLIRAKSFSKSFPSNIYPQTSDFPGQHKAILKSKDVGPTYLGVRGNVSVYNLTVGADQSTSGQVWIENGPTGQRHSLQAGWMVAPHLLGDSLSRSFVYWSGDGGKTGCYNLLCPGFVQVDKDHPIGDFLTPTSSFDGPQFVLDVLVFRDMKTGNWWLTLNQIEMGYWPKSLLSNLDGGGTYVAWGGIVKGPPNERSPPMGNGHFPLDNFYRTCYFAQIKIVNISNYLVNPHEYLVEKYADAPTCYDLDYRGYIGKEMEHAFMFGGPGGGNCGA